MKSFYSIIINILIILSLIGVVQLRTSAQSSSELFKYGEKESLQNITDKNISSHLQQKISVSEASAWFDVTYYRLAIKITTQPNYLKGNVSITGACRSGNTNILTLDLVNNMTVDSVLVNGNANSFIQHSNSFDISLIHTPSAGEILTVDIFYEGAPIATGFGSFIFDSHAGVPWIYSLSEPFGAKDWWPCKIDPADKADSADIIITIDSTLKAGSEGKLMSVTNNGDGTVTYYWKERYPISSYLISVAITNYYQFSNWFHCSVSDSMEILNYVLPEHDSTALQNLPRVVNMLAIYSDLFGLYPFIKEKYGHAEFGRGGAMEHQTMTSTVTFDEDVLSHELAHQWFGDMITCRTWSDLWLNEGFAQYCSALYRERKYGIDSYRVYMNTQLEKARLAQGSIGTPDTSSANTLFNSPLMYSKGAYVLHMLRHVLGDTVFFRCMNSYANDIRFKYSTAAIGDFQSVCETVSGKDLSYFFQEWIYGNSYPKYYYAWTWNNLKDSSFITLKINQIADNTTLTFYIMPIDIRITASNMDTSLTVWNNSAQQTFIIKYSAKPSKILLDPDGWILKTTFTENDIPPSSFKLEQNFPNPFNSSTTIRYQLQKRERVALKVYDILGREITALVNAKQNAGYYEYIWNAENCSSGIYFYRLMTESTQLQKKMVLIR